jgi:hypothetical protein
LLDPLASLVHVLPHGPRDPIAGAHCAGSYSSLGDNVGQGATQQTAIVNLWAVRGKHVSLGWIVKTASGLYWWEDPASAYYEQITPINARELRQNGISIAGCFRSGLSL